MRAIDADALEKAISVSHSMIDDYGVKIGYEICMRLVEDAPTIEPERKTGKWVRDPKSNRWRCSECCSFALRTDYREECLSDYCSVCGAYMKGEQDG